MPFVCTVYISIISIILLHKDLNSPVYAKKKQRTENKILCAGTPARRTRH
jgi:hypothetical protein